MLPQFWVQCNYFKYKCLSDMTFVTEINIYQILPDKEEKTGLMCTKTLTVSPCAQNKCENPH